MNIRFKQEEPAPLIEKPEEPKTKTKSELQKIPPLEETALDMEDSSILDLSIQKLSPLSSSQPLVIVYIRPAKENIDDLLRKGKSRVSYIFKGITVSDLKERFIKILKGLEPEKYTELRKEVFLYNYHIAQKEDVYNSAKSLNENYLRIN